MKTGASLTSMRRLFAPPPAGTPPLQPALACHVRLPCASCSPGPSSIVSSPKGWGLPACLPGCHLEHAAAAGVGLRPALVCCVGFITQASRGPGSLLEVAPSKGRGSGWMRPLFHKAQAAQAQWRARQEAAGRTGSGRRLPLQLAIENTNPGALCNFGYKRSSRARVLYIGKALAKHCELWLSVAFWTRSTRKLHLQLFWADVYPMTAKFRPHLGQSVKTESSLTAMRRLFPEISDEHLVYTCGRRGNPRPH